MYFVTFAEPLPTCAARVDALRSHGHQGAALRLAVAVVRTMKQQQLVAQRRWHESQQQHRNGATTSSTANLPTPCTSRCTTTATSAPVVPNSCTGWGDGWVGHPLDPVGCLFDTLADASLIPDDQTPRTPSYFGKQYVLYYKYRGQNMKPKSLTINNW